MPARLATATRTLPSFGHYLTRPRSIELLFHFPLFIRKMATYSDMDLSSVLSDIENGTLIREAARKYNVLRSTIYNRISLVRTRCEIS